MLWMLNTSPFNKQMKTTKEMKNLKYLTIAYFPNWLLCSFSSSFTRASCRSANSFISSISFYSSSYSLAALFAFAEARCDPIYCWFLSMTVTSSFSSEDTSELDEEDSLSFELSLEDLLSSKN